MFAVAGVALGLNKVSAVDGETVYEAPGPGVSRLRLSSTARDSIVYVPGAGAMKVKVQFSVTAPTGLFAGFQVLPPSVETSTAAITPPPASVAVPVTVTDCPSTGLVVETPEIVDVGGV